MDSVQLLFECSASKHPQSAVYERATHIRAILKKRSSLLQLSLQSLENSIDPPRDLFRRSDPCISRPGPALYISFRGNARLLLNSQNVEVVPEVKILL